MQLPEIQTRLQHATGAQYQVEREIGRGGMAVVYLALDRKHQRFVAIKVVKAHIGARLGAERFVREILLTAKLQHPHILSLYDSGDAGDGLLYYVTPFIEGESLRHRLDGGQTLPVLDALRIAREVADALAYAHQRHIVHRDIKPGNILLGHGHALVADFGIAHALEAAGGETLTEAGAVIGTPAYMSPEQRSGENDLDGRSDVYSLGCVLFEMLTGRLPIASVAADWPRAGALRDDVPRTVDQLLARALARRPADRFQSASELRDALGAAITIIEAPRPPALPDRSAAPADRRANLGPGVSRMCDRSRQVNAFDAAFRAARARAPGRTQVYVIHGDEGQGHGSLVERLAARLDQFAVEIAGDERGTVLSRPVPWPDDGDLEICQRDLKLSLFRELAPAYLGDDLSAAALARLVANARSPIVTVRHDVRASRWNATAERLITWYFDTFWGSLERAPGAPLFVVFLKVIYPTPATGFRLTSWLRRGRDEKTRVATRIKEVLEAESMRCPVTVLGELTPVTLDDVHNWFEENNIYESEHRRRELAASVFQNASAKPFAEVERALERIHHEFVRQATRHQGARAW